MDAGCRKEQVRCIETVWENILSPDMVNYLGEEEEQNFRQEKPAPCYLIATVNDYIAEKDSPFCTNEDISYMLPVVISDGGDESAMGWRICL